MSSPRIRESSTGRTWLLAPLTTFGRDPGAWVHTDDPGVSRLHAAVLWSDDMWRVRDLASANGTYVNGRRIAGADAPIATADLITLGTGASFEVVSLSGPRPFARCARTREEIEDVADLIFLPTPDEAAPAVVYRRATEGWVLERGGEQHAVQDGDWLDLGGRSWRLSLPDAATVVRTETTLKLADVALVLQVSRDWEHVALRFSHRGAVRDLGVLQCWSVILLLAQERLRDRDLPEREQGWRDMDALCRDLAMRRNNVDVAITRARRTLAEHGLAGSERIVEARRGQRRLGLPCDAFVIVTHEPGEGEA